MDTSLSFSTMKDLGRSLRQDVLMMCERTSTGHVGSAFSVADILAVLYSGVLRGSPAEPERDRLILSKGHASAALYAVLHRKGIMPTALYESFAQNGSLLGHHPHYAPEVGLEANTGSLGHGLPLGGGLAYAAKLQCSPSRVFVIQSDGETNEGVVWEAAMFAAHHHLDNLCMILDDNGIQAMGNTRDILFPSEHAARWQAFGWDVHEVDGHDHAQLWEALTLRNLTKKPVAVIAHTIKGKGVSFMENQLLWHYRQPKGEEFLAAMRELATPPDRPQG